MQYRFQWTSPTVFSPHDPNVLYHGGNHVFARPTRDTWDRISFDLTRGDPETMVASGGPITKDNTGAETYATVFAIAESPVQQGVIWTGSDDGLIYLSRDNGATWDNVTPGPTLLPEWRRSRSSSRGSTTPPPAISPPRATSRTTTRPTCSRRPTTAKLDLDHRRHSPRRLHPHDPRGPGRARPALRRTERGLYVSFDAGRHWQSLQLNLPVTPIHDLVITQDDLVVGTHGRSFWILDDITPLRQLARNEVQHGGRSSTSRATPAAGR